MILITWTKLSLNLLSCFRDLKSDKPTLAKAKEVINKTYKLLGDFHNKQLETKHALKEIGVYDYQLVDEFDFYRIYDTIKEMVDYLNRKDDRGWQWYNLWNHVDAVYNWLNNLWKKSSFTNLHVYED